MADRESIYAWLSRKKYRVVDENHPARRIVERLVSEGKARWLCAVNRVSVIPRPWDEDCKDRPCKCLCHDEAIEEPGPHLETCAWADEDYAPAF